MTLPATQPPPSRGKPRRLGPLGRALDARIQRLQQEHLRGAPAGRADLARLRRGLGKPAGSVPEIWELTLGAVPPKLAWDRDQPSRGEQAAHTALTLYALHQQSMPGPAHVPGVGFGRAVAQLSRDPSRSEEAITRRFMAVATAESIDEILAHVRGLITQLRTVHCGIDYARFADDILNLLTPGRQTPVRLAWGRDFHRTADVNDTTSNTTSEE